MKLQLPRWRKVFAAEGGRSTGVECLNTENQQKLQPEPLVCAPVPVRLPIFRCVQVGVGRPAARGGHWETHGPGGLGPVETQRAGHLGTSHPREGLAWWLERQNLVKPACVATSARVAVIAVAEATAWDHFSETADDTPRKRRRRAHIHGGCKVLRSWAGSSGPGRRHSPPRSPQPER